MTPDLQRMKRVAVDGGPSIIDNRWVDLISRVCQAVKRGRSELLFLFCSSTNLTREHLWPGWIVQALKSKFPPRSNLFTGGILTQKQKNKWPASSIDQRAQSGVRSVQQRLDEPHRGRHQTSIASAGDVANGQTHFEHGRAGNTGAVDDLALNGF